MESGLDRSDRIVGNWYKFALRLGISKEDCQQFETRLLDYPTCKLFQYLTTKNTKLTLEKLEKELRSIKRNNLANILREIIKREGMWRLNYVVPLFWWTYMNGFICLVFTSWIKIDAVCER